MTLGLLPGTVRLARTHSDWQEEFGLAADPLRTALVGMAVVEHVGSTAVADLAAKPIIDIAIGLREPQFANVVFGVLNTLGYRYRGYREDAGGHIWGYAVTGRYTRHVHMVLLHSDQWNRYVILRDFLLCSPVARASYEAHKLRLAALYSANRRQYTAAKMAVIDELLYQAAGSGIPNAHLPTRRLKGLLVARCSATP